MRRRSARGAKPARDRRRKGVRRRFPPEASPGRQRGLTGGGWRSSVVPVAAGIRVIPASEHLVIYSFDPRAWESTRCKLQILRRLRSVGRTSDERHASP